MTEKTPEQRAAEVLPLLIGWAAASKDDKCVALIATAIREAVAAERAEVGRLKTVWAMEGLMRRLLALALNDWEQEHGVRSGYEKDGADHWSAQARTVFASDPTDAIGTKILTERDEARAESDRLRAELAAEQRAATGRRQPVQGGPGPCERSAARQAEITIRLATGGRIR